jgi:hypothetical protein
MTVLLQIVGSSNPAEYLDQLALNVMRIRNSRVIVLQH